MSANAPAVPRTAIELPYGLLLRQDQTARWSHATRPVTHNGRTQLWHTRLTAETASQTTALSIMPPELPHGDSDGFTTALTPAYRR